MSEDIRGALVRSLEKDLIGPRDDDESFHELPTLRYLTGVLFPAGTLTDESEDDSRSESGGGDEDDDDADDAPQAAQAYRPSSIGLTCEVTGDVVELTVVYSRYRAEGTGASRRWHRQSKTWPQWVNLPKAPGLQRWDLDDSGAVAELLVRYHGSTRILTLFLANRCEPSETVQDADCIFQPKITLRGCVVARTAHSATNPDPDALRFQLLYRDFPEFAVGHGCAVTWDEAKGSCVASVSTCLMPVFEVPQVMHYDRADLRGLDMMALACAGAPSETVTALKPILDDYEAWISKRESEVADLPSNLVPVAAEHLSQCREAARRIGDGLSLIEKDKKVFQAFCFANEVMAYQRARTEFAKAYKKTGQRPQKSVAPSGRWRPFQVAFILLNLQGIVNPASPERKVADLLWFATGGGKTEAYLGLAAFVLGYRRLRGRDSVRDHAGVTVLMRYTLRLLTVQQYQRATTMICAAEYLRRREPRVWGTEPFLIGLWVGRNTTPNTIKDALEALERMDAGEKSKESNPIQLQNCPWCGKELFPSDYRVDTRRDWLLIHCSNEDCDFTGPSEDADTALPALVVDEDIYHRCPSLLIGTVDKFARLPWNAKTGSLFGLVRRRCGRHGFLTAAESEHPESHRANRGLPTVATDSLPFLQPPELIIQDELHLISGPLGTMVGLFETAVDYLCTLKGGFAPKVVASTATIRRAGEQVKNLFARELRQFPPPGLNANNSFFARHATGNEIPGRLYVGVCASGKSGKTTMVRVFGSLLQAIQEMKAAGKDPRTLDPYGRLPVISTV